LPPVVGCGAAAALSESLIVVARSRCDAMRRAGGMGDWGGDVGGGDGRVDIVNYFRLGGGRFKDTVVVLNSRGRVVVCV